MLIIHTDSPRCRRLAVALEDGGFTVIAAGTIAEVERWPDDIVVTDLTHFTPVWKACGALHVVVLAPDPQSGEAACEQGASLWVPYDCEAEPLVRLVQSLAGSRYAPATAVGAGATSSAGL